MKSCSRCNAEIDSDKPRGWKCCGDELLCAECLRKAYVFRSVNLTVARIDDLAEGQSFFAPFTQAWRLSTDLANWAQLELARRDVVRTPAMTKLPKMPPFNLYKHFGSNYPERSAWNGFTGAASAIFQLVYRAWVGRWRYAVVWRGDSRAARYRWPYPFIVRRQDYRLAWRDDPGGRLPILSLNLPGGRATLVLAQGQDYARPLRDFDALATGIGERADVKIVGQFSGGKLRGVGVRIGGLFPRKLVAGVDKELIATVTTEASGCCASISRSGSRGGCICRICAA